MPALNDGQINLVKEVVVKAIEEPDIFLCKILQIKTEQKGEKELYNTNMTPK